MTRLMILVLCLSCGFIPLIANDTELKDPTQVDPRLKNSWKQSGTKKTSSQADKEKPLLKGRIISRDNKMVLIEYATKVHALKEGDMFSTEGWGKIKIKTISNSRVSLEAVSSKKEWILK